MDAYSGCLQWLFTVGVYGSCLRWVFTVHVCTGQTEMASHEQGASDFCVLGSKNTVGHKIWV